MGAQGVQPLQQRRNLNWETLLQFGPPKAFTANKRAATRSWTPANKNIQSNVWGHILALHTGVNFLLGLWTCIVNADNVKVSTLTHSTGRKLNNRAAFNNDLERTVAIAKLLT